MGRNVILDVSGNGSNILRHLCDRIFVDNLVGTEETEGIREVLESLDDLEHTSDVVQVVIFPWCNSVERFIGKWTVDINDHIDTSGIEDGGTSGVIDIGIEVVDTNSIHAQSLHEDGIAQAGG